MSKVELTVARARETSGSPATSPDYTMNRHTIISSLRKKMRSPEDSGPVNEERTTRLESGQQPCDVPQPPYPSSQIQDPASSSSWFSMDTPFERDFWSASMEPMIQTGQPVISDSNNLGPISDRSQLSSDFYSNDSGLH